MNYKPNPDYISCTYSAAFFVFPPRWIRTRKQRLSWWRLYKKHQIRDNKKRQIQMYASLSKGPNSLPVIFKRTDGEPRTINFTSPTNDPLSNTH